MNLLMKNHWILCLIIICHISGEICVEIDEDESSSEASPLYANIALDHPDKSGYQSQHLGSEKHKYGYELKSSGKHFHHTSTEQDGVRLGCFGYELEGKMYVTQYVADARGYRLVTNQDLITVYPKNGAERKPGLPFINFNDEDDNPRNVRYFFPKGCKGIDVQIDNSSRLRSLKFDNNARLPVTLKPANSLGDSYYTRPPQNYPGPSNIYAPSLVPIQTARPPTSYLPPQNLENANPPPNKLNNTYLPPLPENSIENTYLPPEVEPSSNIDNISTSSSSSPYKPTYTGESINELLPPKEPNNCPTSNSIEYCDHHGCIIIPIALKNQRSENCCSSGNFAKLIIPFKQFDSDTIKQIKETVPRELDVNDLLENILKLL